MRLALSEGCSPDRILFLVPNRAQKMALQDKLTHRLLFEEGLDALIAVPVYTWHGLAHHLVTRHYDMLGYSEPPVLLTSPEQWGDVREALVNEDPLNWSEHHRHLLGNRGFVDEVVDFCIRAEQRVLREPELNALAKAKPAWADVIRFFKAHRRRLQARARVDYPMLLNEATDLLANFDDVREALHQRFLHILVDDGQELALVQQKMLHFLTQFTEPGASTVPDRSLVLAGDPDSAIETFRGAEPEWIQDFAKEFGPHESVTLTTCYRQSAEMGEQSTRLIARNGGAEHRPTAFAGEATLEVRAFGSLAAEVDAIARELRLTHLEQKIPFEDMAILLTSPRSMLAAAGARARRARGAVLDQRAGPSSRSGADRSSVHRPRRVCVRGGSRTRATRRVAALSSYRSRRHVRARARATCAPRGQATRRTLASPPEQINGDSDAHDKISRAARAARSVAVQEERTRRPGVLGRVGPLAVVRFAAGSGAPESRRSRAPRSRCTGCVQPRARSFRRAQAGGRNVRAVHATRSAGPTSVRTRGCRPSVRPAASTSCRSTAPKERSGRSSPLPA